MQGGSAVIRHAGAGILGALAYAAFGGTTVSAQALPDHTAKIAEGVYSYGPGNDYFSMFVVTGEGVIAFESVMKAWRVLTDDWMGPFPGRLGGVDQAGSR